MYSTITLSDVLPRVFADTPARPSDVWRTELSLERGRSYLVDAASGLGKSSLCSFIYGHRGDYLGRIALDGRDVRELRPSEWTQLRMHTLSILWQDLKLFPELTALENVLIKNRLMRHRTETEIRLMLEQLGLGDRIHTPAGRLSLGQQQRVGLVRSLCQPFDFLLLDEPISHLDEHNARIAAELIRSEATASGAAIIVTSVGHALPLSYDHILSL